MSRAIVIGGGVIGACCAYSLAKAGCEVTLLERGAFGAGCSHANCGYVSPSHVLPLAGPGVLLSMLKTVFQSNSPLKIRAGTVLRDPGWFLRFAQRCNARDASASGHAIRALLASSRRLYDEMLATEVIDCDWQSKGLLFVFRTAAAMEHYAHVDDMLRERFDTPARRLGAAELSAFEPSLKDGLAGGWHYEWDGHLRPDRLMRELRRVLVKHGVTIRELCEVTNIASGKVDTASGAIEADHVVVAAGAWTPKLGFRVPIQPGKGYSITFPPFAGSPRLPMIFEEARVAVTPFADGFRIGSTMEFAGYDATLNRDRLRLLTDGVKEYLKSEPSGPPSEEWWGWRPMTPDSVPLIGPTAQNNVWLAAGHNMLGLSMAPATGKLIAEMVTGQRPHLDAAPYAPSRF